MALSSRVTYAGTFTPAANSVLLAIVYAVRNATATPWTPANITVTGGGLTWTRVAIATGPGVAGDYADSLQAWVATVGGSPASMTVTAAPPSSPADAAYAVLTGVVYGWTGYDTADPVGGISQATSGPTDGLWSPTLDAAPAATSEVISAFGGITGGAGNVNPEAGAGWTPGDRLSALSLYCLETQSRRDSTSDVCAWSDTSGPSATTFLYFGPTSIAVEIKGDGLPPVPEVTSTSSTTPRRESTFTVNGSAFGAAQGTQQLRVGGQVQPVSSWSATQIVCPHLNGANNKNGVPVNVEIWDGGVLVSNSFALTGLLPKVGWSYVNVTSIGAINPLEATPPIEVGDQIEFENPAVVDPDTVPNAPAWLPSWQFRVWDNGGGGWGNTGLQIVLTARLGLFDRLMRLLAWF